MTARLRRHWFLVALLVLIPLGVVCGLSLGASVREYTRAVQPRWITAAALFLMAFTLDSSQLRKSLSSPWPVILATSVNFGVIPLLALVIAPFQLADDFRYGLIIAASVPCTMAAASVWTRQAGGNDAVSLLVTLITNSACVVVSPFWLRIGTGEAVELPFSQMTLRLLGAVLIPGLLGQLLRLNRKARQFAIDRKARISIVAMAFILCLVFASACDCGVQLQTDQPSPSIAAVALVWASCIGLHLTGMIVAALIAKMTGVSDFDRPAVLFASSQKTLPIGVLLSREVGTAASVPFAVFPMLMFHATQLVIDTAIANRLKKSKPQPAEQTDESHRE